MKETLTKRQVLLALKKALPSLRDKYGVEKIAIFGSFAREDQRLESDIDVMVHLKEPLGLDFVSLAYELEDVLGREVEVVTFESLKRNMANPRYSHIAADIERTLTYV